VPRLDFKGRLPYSRRLARQRMTVKFGRRDREIAEAWPRLRVLPDVIVENGLHDGRLKSRPERGSRQGRGG
jgi:hypothetical protein